MCIIFLAYNWHPEYSLIVAANRDEFYSRPSAAAGFWSDNPEILAGRDLEQQGTWLGITRQGRFAAITNYRDPASMEPNALSRGHLVSNFLAGSESGQDYLAQVAPQADQYNGFNLLVGTLADKGGLWYYSNKEGVIRGIEPGIHGLSNHLLNTPWPKVEKGKKSFAVAIGAEENQLEESLCQLLEDRSEAADELLPSTGVAPELERLLSSIHIVSPTYGTRATTVLRVKRDGGVKFAEKSLDFENNTWLTVEYPFSFSR